MSRLFNHNGLWGFGRYVSSCVYKRRIMGFLPVSSASHQRHNYTVRQYSTGNRLWQDALQSKIQENKPDELQTIDLDKWKSVMRSQIATEEKQVSDKVEARGDDGISREPGGESKDGSLLEATRDLVTMWRHAGKLVPQEMTDEEVQHLAGLTTKSSKKNYLKYLAIKEGHKRARKEKQQKRRAEREASAEQNNSTEEGNEQRGAECKNTFLLQFWSRSLDKLLAWRSAQSMVFDQPLVFDMSYESSMSRREVENTVSQLMEVEGWNRRAAEPFHLHFCNLQNNGTYMQEFLKRYGAETWNRLLITSTDQQHVDVFPREQLVYLTADSPNVLRTFDHSKVYIIGALVDRSIQSGLSLANAKRLKLATARLPLDEYLQWDIGAKNLTLDQMIRIMIKLRQTGKWEEALKFVPQRKHDGFLQQRKQKETTSNQIRGVPKYGLKEDGDSRFRFSERNFKNEGQSLHRPQNRSGFTGKDRIAGDRDKTTATRTRTTFKNSREGRKDESKRKMWWDEE